MVYIPPGSTFSAGRILGDAKTLETRGVPYKVNADGVATPPIALGDVVYIDENGFAVPFDRYAMDGDDHIPYGVVGNVSRVNPNGPKSSAPGNTVRIVTEGVVAVKYWPPYNADKTHPPKLGDPVNQFGCKAEGIENECVIGICDGVGTDPVDTNTIVVAVRLTTGAAASVAYTPTLHLLVKNIQQSTGRNDDDDDDDDGTIPAYAPVRIMPSTDEDELPLVKQWTSEAQQLYGFAAEPIAPGETGYVVIKGPIEVPYVEVDTVAGDKKTLSRGHRVVWVRENGVGIDWNKIFEFIKSAASVVGSIVDVGSKVANCKSAWNSAGLLSKSKPAPKAILGKTTKNGVNEEPVIDGWFTIDVDPQFIHAPMSMDYVVAEDESTSLIPGHVYGGCDSGVMEYQTNWDGYPFAGVCTGLATETGKQPILREGAVDVIAADDWAAGDYIDYTRHSIPEAYELYTPHIGVAAADTAAGELGAVHLQPWDPNEYIVLDHVKLMEDDEGNLPLNTSVYQLGHQIHGCPKNPTDSDPYPDGNCIGLRGILRSGIQNYSPDPEEEYPDRAIIQSGGYVQIRPGALEPPLNWYDIGSPVRALGETWVDAIYPQAIGADVGFMQLGMVVSTFSAVEASEGVVVVKLDIRHHPRLVVEVTGREDVRFAIKKVIPLVKTDDNKIALANWGDDTFWIEGLNAAVYLDPTWKTELRDSLGVTPITESALGLKRGSDNYSIISGFTLVGENNIRLDLNGVGIPDQWETPAYRVVGYEITLTTPTTSNVYLRAPVYFIMNSDNARKPPIGPTETRESDEQNWVVRKKFEPHEVTPENVRSEAVDVVDAPAADQYTPPIDDVLGPDAGAGAGAAPAAGQPTPSIDEVIDEAFSNVERRNKLMED